MMGLLSVLVWADPPTEQCTANAISHDCAVFKDLPSPKISVQNGSFQNPLKRRKTLTDADATRLAKIQDDIEAFSQQITRPPMSRRFRRALLDPNTLGAAGNEAPLLLPWPPQDPNASVQAVPFAKFKTFFIDKLSDKDQEQLSHLVDRIETKDAVNIDAAKINKKRIHQVNDLLEQARRSAIQSVTKGRPDEALTNSERIAVKKLQTVKFIGIDNPDYADYFDCAVDEPNASYDSESHALTICPAMYLYPDSNLVNTLGHELGHAVDPCDSQFVVYRINLKKMKEYATKVPASDTKAHWALDHLMDNDNGDFVTTDFARRLERPAIMDDLEKAGALTRVTDGIAPQDYFLNDTIACLKTKEDIRGDMVDSAQVARDEQTFLEESNIKEAPLAAKFRGQFPHCDALDIHGISQMSESIADVFGVHALEDYLRTHPPKTTAERLAPFADFYQELCRPADEREKDTLSASDDFDPNDFQLGSYEAYVARLSAAHAESADDHPPSSKRINRIYMKSALIRAAYGCEPSADGGCTGSNEVQSAKLTEPSNSPGTHK